MGLLENKVALITGASKGIGLAIARKFAENGATLILNASTNSSLENIAQELLLQSNTIVDTAYFDVSDETGVKSCFQSIFKKHKRLDILVNNAGILEPSLIGMVTSTQVQKQFAVNTFGPIYTCQYASRLMTRNKQGSIINISSIMGIEGEVGQSVYSASKAALVGLSKSLAKELAFNNIRVNTLSPGFIDTDMARSATDEKYAQRLASIKLGRVGTCEEVANSALFLASDLSSYVTGQNIGVDGGMII